MTIPQKQIYTEDDYYAIPEDVREYWIVDPMKQTVFVYHLEETKFEVNTYTFFDKVKVNIYEDLWIDFSEIRDPQ